MSRQLPSPKEAIRILGASGCSPDVIRHCKAVSALAVRLAERCARNGVDVDLELVRVGALLHDIGRSRTHSVQHPVVGAELARSLGLPTPVVAIIERHLGGGISAEEATELGWPGRTYLPETLEEKIVTYSDKLLEGNRVLSVEEAIQKLGERLGTDHPSVKRVMHLHEEITKICLEPGR